MKFICTGDWHLTATPPKKRIDEYIIAQQQKIDFIFSTAKKEKCSFILQPGDFYDHHTEPYWLVRKYVKLINEHCKDSELELFTLFGQHDQRYHTVQIENTPLGMTEVSPYLFFLGQEPLIKGNIHIYGTDWSQELPKIKDEQAINILVIHRMIIQDKLWEQQEEYDRASHILRKNDFDLIVAGDNHTFFTQKVGNRYLFNCGSIMRSTVNQEKHKPTIFVVEITNGKIIYTPIEIPIQPFTDVFNLEEVKEQKKNNKKLNQFISNLTQTVNNADLDYYGNLNRYMQTEQIEQPIIDIIHSVIPKRAL